jgi:hypothetical protein
MTREDVLQALGNGLMEHGFQGRSRHFQLSWPELEWMVQLEMIPRTERVGTYVGLSPQALLSADRPTKANDCPIIFHPESGGEPFGLDHWRVWEALSLESGLSDDERQGRIDEFVRAVAAVANRVRSMADLRLLAANGHLRGFVRKDARALLSA